MKRKCLAIGIILLFVAIAVNPITGISHNRDDTTPPVTTISLNPPEPDGENGWYVSDVTVILNASDNESGVNATYYQINNGGWVTYTSTIELQECGIIVVQFYSVDNAGNVEVPKQVEIKIDFFHPITYCFFSPPNGNNGWYINNITVTLNATDDLSGVNVTYYMANHNPWQIYTVPFVVYTEGYGAYYSIDKAGNQEPPNTVFFRMDTTPPEITMFYTWEKVCWTNQYHIIVTATASDAMSGMDKVEFYYNDVLQATVNGTGPTYTWTYAYAPLPNVVVKAIAYDKAGLNDFKELINPTSYENQQSQSQTTVKQPYRNAPYVFCPWWLGIVRQHRLFVIGWGNSIRVS
jgi:hypothetical protein